MMLLTIYQNLIFNNSMDKYITLYNNALKKHRPVAVGIIKKMLIGYKLENFAFNKAHNEISQHLDELIGKDRNSDPEFEKLHNWLLLR